MVTHDRLWSPPPTVLRLADNEVHIWRANLDLTSVQEQCLNETLSADELARAAGSHFEKDRRHFVAGRGILRNILARYFDVAPERLQFSCGHYGKADLSPAIEHEELKFDLSHSDGLALIVVARNREVGIDVERIKANLEVEEIAKRFFSSSEAATLHDVSLEMKPMAFFDCWTRKEAYIKARGEGLTLPLASFDVSLAPGEPAALLATRDEPQEASR